MLADLQDALSYHFRTANIRIELQQKPTYISIGSICRLSKESAYRHFKALLTALLERGLGGTLMSQGSGLHGLCTRSEQKLWSPVLLLHQVTVSTLPCKKVGFPGNTSLYNFSFTPSSQCFHIILQLSEFKLDFQIPKASWTWRKVALIPSAI